MLPGLSGFDLLRQLRQKKKAMPVIMLTARQHRDGPVLGFELGVDDNVTKPFSLLELLGRIAAVFASHGARRLEAPATPAAPAITSQAGAQSSETYWWTSTASRDQRRHRIFPCPLAALRSSKRWPPGAGRWWAAMTLMDDVWGVVMNASRLRTLNNLMSEDSEAIEVKSGGSALS